jgi:hypothetical protein
MPKKDAIEVEGHRSRFLRTAARRVGRPRFAHGTDPIRREVDDLAVLPDHEGEAGAPVQVCGVASRSS